MKKRPDVDVRITKSGLWCATVGERGNTVTIREKRKGGPLVLDHALNRAEPTEIRIRDTRGKIIEARAQDAIELARDKAAQNRLNRARRDVADLTKMTVERAYDLYFDAEAGGLPPSRQARTHHRGARAFWTQRFDADTPWNQVAPADVTAGANKLKAEGKVQTADKYVKCLRTVAKWLIVQKDIDGLKDPTRKFNFKALWEGYAEKQPRYTAAEIRRLMAVRDEVDPRFALMLVLDDDSGARSAALRRAKRSMLDERLDMPPTMEQAPYGWLYLPAMKGQQRTPILLTLRQRLALVRAMWKRWNGVRFAPGVLSHLEERWQLGGEDYFLIPGGYLPRDGVVRKSMEISEGTPINWLHEAEEKAGIKAVEGRAWHGLRRAVSDHIYDETDLDTLTDALGWLDRDTPAEIYVSKQKTKRLVKAREVMERKGEEW